MPCAGDSQTVRRGLFQNIVYSFNLCVLFFQAANKLLGQIVIKLFGHNYLMYGRVRYFFWPRGAVKNAKALRAPRTATVWDPLPYVLKAPTSSQQAGSCSSTNWSTPCT